MILFNENGDLNLSVLDFNCLDEFIKEEEYVFVPFLLKRCKDIKIKINKGILIKKGINALISSHHVNTYYFIKELKKRYDFNRILMLDSHPDLDNSKLNDGSFLYHLLKEGIIKEVMLIGISNPGINELEFIDRKNIKVYSSLDYIKNKIKIINNIREFTSEKFYLSIDLDVLNIDLANWREFFGFTPLQLIDLLSYINYENMVGFDIVELKNCKYVNIVIKLLKEICCMKL